MLPLNDNALETPPIEAVKLVRRLTIKQKIFMWLGYGDIQQPHFEENEPEGFPKEYFMLITMCQLNFKARLRLLLGGVLVVRASIKTIPRIENSVNKIVIGILPPGTRL